MPQLRMGHECGASLMRIKTLLRFNSSDTVSAISLERSEVQRSSEERMQLKYKSFTDVLFLFSLYRSSSRPFSTPPQQRHSHIFTEMPLVKNFKKQSLLYLGARKRQSKLHSLLFAAGSAGIRPDRGGSYPSAHRQPRGRQSSQTRRPGL